MVRFRKWLRILAWNPTVTTVGYGSTAGIAQKIDKAKRGIFSTR
jgi:hypothetical protein